MSTSALCLMIALAHAARRYDKREQLMIELIYRLCYPRACA